MRLKLAGFIVAAFSLVAAQSAFAADMPTKMPVKAAPMAAATPWTGFYVNGGVGYGMWAADTTVLNGAGVCIICENQVQGGKGWLATAGAGYDYQFTAKIVAGLFGDASISDLKGSILDRFILGTGDIKQTSSWAFGARAGWLVTPKTMSYVNGGYTAARFSGTDLVFRTDGTPTGFSTPGFTANGWFLGGGVETAVSPGWFWRTEYRYAYYGTKTLAESPANNIITFKPTVQTVTSQIVYKFNGGLAAPVYPAMPAVATNWTGFYVNAGAGYGLWEAETTETLVGAATCTLCVTRHLGGKGYLARVGGGYDWQFAPTWVAGVFGDFDISSLKGTIQNDVGAAAGSIKQTSAWAVGPRLGWLPSPQTMTYVNGGYTAARFSGTDMVMTIAVLPPLVANTTPAFTTSGWFLGGGVETTFDFFGMLGKNWFWRNEYRYARYGNKDVPYLIAGVVFENIAFKPTVQTVTSSIVFKLN